MSKIELLAPAGSPEGVRAAVQGGASAVYMGFGNFNARRNAKGFSKEEIAQAISYCRQRNVKTNITLNILVSDRELSAALDDARFLYEAGADALIIQDIGLAKLIHQHAPDFALHASTQMTIHTLDGAKTAKELGFSRVVLSRECSKQTIKQITEQAGVETEIFVHGALCMCYSGQCYLSAVIGQRSGNRGLCAQPCRLSYAGGYPLSLKDLCLADYVSELSDIGVSSLKIEGRMKRPEYTYLVSKIYADIIKEHRKATEEEKQILYKIFSRDGFTDGYLTGQKGDSMFGTKTDIPFDEVKELYSDAALAFAEGKEADLVAVDMHFTASEKEGAVLRVQNITETAEVQQAEKRETTAEMAEKALRKTGGTPFYINDLTIDLEKGLMVPASSMNQMRRNALERLLAQKTEIKRADWIETISKEKTEKQHGFSGFTASVRTYEQANMLSDLGVSSIYVPLAVAAETGMDAVLPRIFSENEQKEIEEMLYKAKSKGTKNVLVGNIGQIALTKQMGFTVFGDFGLNAYNSETLKTLASLGVCRQTLSFEARLAQLRDMDKQMETELIVYGKLPLMIFENCAIKSQNNGKCSCKDKTTYLTDRKNQKFELLSEFGCRNTMLNSLPLCINDEFQTLGITHARLYFTTESPEECRKIATSFLQGDKLVGEFTKGLYYRGVE